jgi:integrase
MSRPRTPPTVYQKDGAFYVKYTHHGRLRHQTLLGAQSRQQAHRMIQPMVLGWLNGTWPAFKTKAPADQTVSALLTRYVRERDQAAGHLTSLSIVRHLNEVFGSLSAHAIDQYHLAEYVQRNGGFRAAATLANELGYLKSALRWAKTNWREWGALPEPPAFQRVKRQAREFFWNERQIMAILLACHGKGEIEIMINLCALTGTRVGAAHALTWDRINWSDNRIDFEVPGAPRTRKRPQRHLKVSAGLIELLREYKEAGGGTATRVFKRVPMSLSRDLERILTVTNLPRGTFHTFRHSWATNALAKGMSVPAVAQCLSCTPDVILKTYGKPAADSEERGAALYG